MIYIVTWLVMALVLFAIGYLLFVVCLSYEMSFLGLVFFAFVVSSILLANELRRPKHQEYLRHKALYPKIPKQYLQDKPISESVIFGKDHHTGKLVCSERGRHTIIVGSTGSGKTATSLIPTILSCNTGSKQIVDIKSRELSFKTGNIQDQNTMIIDLNRKDDYVWGWDIFYKLKRDGTDTEQEVLDILKEVASVVVPKTNSGDDFWNSSARNEFIGLMLFEFIYKKNYEFIDCVTSILNIPLREHLESALDTVPKLSIVTSYLNGLSASADETLFSVDITLSQCLFPFLDENIVYFLKTNRQRANPQMLNRDGITQYLCVDEHKLDTGYDRIFCIVMKQTLMELQARTTTNDYPTTQLIYDEFQKLSESVTEIRGTVASFLKTGRSKKTSLVLAFQNLDNIKREEIYDMLSNAHYLYLLSSNNSNSLTTEIVCKMAGSYYEKTQNYSEGRGTSISTSFQEKPILKPEDLNNLGEDAVLIISNFGYVRTRKEGTAYYKVQPFKTQYEKLIAVNKTVMADV